MSVQPFVVGIPQETLVDLHPRLSRTRWTDEVSDAGWDYGANLGCLEELVDYWQNGFDWHQREEELNRFAQFCAEVDGFGLHFVHERGQGPDPMPIVPIHGWPDSFFRMLPWWAIG